MTGVVRARGNCFKPGDLVLKNGDYDQGCRGIIIEINTNSERTVILKVMKSNGEIVNWYSKLVEVINESR